MKVVGSIMEELLKDKGICPGTCYDCALKVYRSGKMDCMIPEGMECPLEDGYCFENV